MNVTLLAYTPDPEKTIALSAKLCYSNSSIDELDDKLTDDIISDYVNMLMSLGHESPLEHVSFTFGIEGISRACSHQLVRHRIASYSQQSQRYVNEEHFKYIIPESIEKNPKALEKYVQMMDTIDETYTDIVALLVSDLIDKEFPELCAASIDKAAAENRELIDTMTDDIDAARKKYRKIVQEDARMVLPNACETKIIVTMNIRSLLNFFKHRCCNRAQWEIRNVANEMLAIVKEIAPNVFKNAGPPCLNGACPEGKMSCGKPYRKTDEEESFKKTHELYCQMRVKLNGKTEEEK